jgi:hypothetical protein
MSTFRRLVVAVGAPLVVVVGLGVVWGVRNAGKLKAQIEAWADSLEHSPNPVTMHLGFVPAYIEGDKVGKLDAVVIERHKPGTVDSIRIELASVDEADLEKLSECSIHLDPDAFDRRGPVGGVKHAMQCISDTSGLVRFGSVGVVGADQELGLFLAKEDLPCEHMPGVAEVAVVAGSGEATSVTVASGSAGTACTEFSDQIHRLRTEVREEVRLHVRSKVRNR